MKLTDSMARRAVAMHNAGTLKASIQRALGISKMQLWNLLNGKIQKHAHLLNEGDNGNQESDPA